MNHFHAIGHIATDPIRRETTKGIVTSFRLAAGAKGPTQLWIDVETWGHQAGTTYTHGTKGRAIAISGHLTQKTWRDRTTGDKRTRLLIITKSLKLLPARLDTSDGYGTPNHIQLTGNLLKADRTSANEPNNGGLAHTIATIRTKHHTTSFTVPVLMWGAQATCSRHLKVGQECVISGRLAHSRPSSAGGTSQITVALQHLSVGQRPF